LELPGKLYFSENLKMSYKSHADVHIGLNPLKDERKGKSNMGASAALTAAGEAFSGVSL